MAMNASINMMTAQISFLEGRLALIHIPLQHYPFFLQPICRLLWGEDHDEDAHKIPWPYRHGFLNFSMTPVECSVICSRELADRFFKPLVQRFNKLSRKSTSFEPVDISAEDFSVIQVDGQGLDAGQRVLELTSPLALAGISLFFQTTYFSDYILVPHRSIHVVKKTFEQRGFTFSPSADAYVSQYAPSSPLVPSHSRQPSGGNPFDFPERQPVLPSSPPASNIKALQTETFRTLQRIGIVPKVDRSIRLVSCAGRKDADPNLDARLRHDLSQILFATGSDPPNAEEEPSSVPNLSTRFLSFTLTSDEPISLLLEPHLLSTIPHLALSTTLLFSKSLADLTSSNIDPEGKDPTAADLSPGGPSDRDTDLLIPIILDLRALSLEDTGIVCGVAGRLADGTRNLHTEGHPSPLPSPTTIPLPDPLNTLVHSNTGPHSSTIPIPTSSSSSHHRSRGHHHRLSTSPTQSPPTPLAPAAAPARVKEETRTDVIEISFLSTARAGTVIVRQSELERAVHAIEGVGMPS